MTTRLLLLLALSLGLTGCGDDSKPEEKKSTSADGAAAAVPDTADTGGTEPKDAEADHNVADGGTLELPPSLSGPMAEAYTQFRHATDPRQVAQLANISQQIGMQLAQAGDDDGYDFFRQSAELARQAQARGARIPKDVLASWIYNEACAYAKAGDTAKAMKSLEEAVVKGFDDMDLIASDPDIESLRTAADFDKQLDGWKAAAAEYVITSAKEELAAGESFPFSFKLTDLDGEEQSIEKYRGQVVVVDVWGTWCGPCVAEIPSFIKLKDKFGPQGFEILGLAYERGEDEAENAERVSDFAKLKGINYPCILGTEAEQDQIPDFGAFPTTLFIDKSGKVRLKVVGATSYEHLEALVSVLMQESA